MVRNTIDSEDCCLRDQTSLVLSSTGIVSVVISGDAGDNQHTSSGACRQQLQHLTVSDLLSNVTYRSGQYAGTWVPRGSME